MCWRRGCCPRSRPASARLDRPPVSSVLIVPQSGRRFPTFSATGTGSQVDQKSCPSWLALEHRPCAEAASGNRISSIRSSGCPSWIRIEPCALRRNQSSGSCLRKSGKCGSPPKSPRRLSNSLSLVQIAPSRRSQDPRRVWRGWTGAFRPDRAV